LQRTQDSTDKTRELGMSGTLTLVTANRMVGRGKGCITH